MPKRKKSDPPEVTIADKQALEQLLDSTDLKVDTSANLSRQEKEINLAIAKLEAGSKYIDDNKPFGSKKNTIRIAQTRISDRIALLTQGLSEIEAEKTIQQNIAARQTVARDVDLAGKGVITFVNVGMGDCTLITTPNGARIMIDCGSDGTADVKRPKVRGKQINAETHLRNTINSRIFLKGADLIHMLFLTHPDADHYNKLRGLLKPLNARFHLVYYAGAENIESFTGLSGSSYIKSVAGTSAVNLKKISYREEAALVGNTIPITRAINDNKDMPGSGAKDVLGKEYVDPTTKAIVLYYEDNFKISVLAANVTGIWDNEAEVFIRDNESIKSSKEPKRTATEKNLRSLVVLVECFNKKILICGDATAITEKFVTENSPNQLENVDTLRMAHHGSPTSSAVEFINGMTNLKTAVASTGGQKIKKHFLPQKKILSLFQPKVASGLPPHTIYAYDSGDMVAYPYFKGITADLWATGSTDTYTLIVDSTTV